MSEDLKGKVAIVTGAGRGIGRAIATTFAQAGAAVLLNDLDDGALAVVERELDAGGADVGRAAGDIGDPDLAGSLPAIATDRFGRLDIVVNNAATFRPAPFLDLGLNAFDDVFRVNLRGPFVLSQRAARQWISAGQPGAIVNVSSVSAAFSQPTVSHYGASKAALERLSKSMALELAPHGIRVNCVAPGGPILSDYVAEIMQRPGYEDYAARRPPLGRLGEPAEVADAVAYLASDAASFVTGAVLCVDGGLTLGRR